MRRVVMLVVMMGLGLLTAGLPGDDAAEAAKRRLRNVTRTDIVPQSDEGWADANGKAIGRDPLAFTRVGKLVRLTQISITATIVDGDTGPGEGDENELTLVLDGIDTGIKLNGFRDNTNDTLTISGVPANGGQILAALKADGKLEATIGDADAAVSNAVYLSPGYGVTLTLKGKQKR